MNMRRIYGVLIANVVLCGPALALSAGDTVFVGEQLKGQGLAGAIIIVLMSVIGLMGTAIALMWRHSNKVYGYRLAERDTLNTALNESKTAVASMLAATKERNEITDEMADVIAKQSASFDMLTERIRSHYERLVDDNSRLNMVVTSISEAMRQTVGISTDTRNKLDTIEKSLIDIEAVILRPRRQKVARKKAL